MSEKIRVLIVGAGRIAGLNESDAAREKPCTHAGAYRSDSRFELAGVVDQSRELAEKFGQVFGIAAWTDLDKALETIRPDHVSVAVPYQFHHDIVMACARSAHRPRSIFSEKPIADTLARAEKMVAACRENSVTLFVNNRRLTPIYQLAKTIIESELESEIVTLNGWCSSGLHAIGLHLLDLMRFICGDVAWVTAAEEPGYVEKLPYSANFVPTDPRVRGLIGFRSGIVAGFANTALTNYTYFELEVLCRKGKLRVSDNGNLLEVWKTPRPGTSTLSYKLTDPERRAPGKSALFAEIARAIGDELAPATVTQPKSGNDHPLSGRNGLESYRLLDHLAVSAKEGGRRIEF